LQLVRSGLARHAECGPGCWAILNDANQIVLEGTWSASKSAASRHVPGPLESSRVRRLPAGRLSQNRFPARGKLRTTPLSKLLPICCNERWKSGWPTHGAAAALQEIGG